jgi:Icc protein
MPLLTATRRQFLLASASAAFAQEAKRETVRWALCSDTHIHANRESEYRGFKMHQNLGKVIPQVTDFKPDAVLINGDLARLEGASDDYDALKDALAPLIGRVPIALGLGNHDDRKNFYEVFGDKQPGAQPMPQKHVLVADYGPVRMMVLDSLMLPNFTPGFLGRQQRAWIENFLKSSDDRPVIAAVHHTLDDSDTSLLDVERLLKVVAPAKNFKAIIYGHSHAYSYRTYEGIHLVNIPAIGYNFSDHHPVGWVAATFSRTGAEMTLRAIGGNTADDGKTTRLTWR